jgi:hypothetical protein
MYFLSEFKMVCQSQLLARDPYPAENRVEEGLYPVEDGEIKGFSMAPIYSLKQLREIERRSIKSKLTSRTRTKLMMRNKRILTLSDPDVEAEFDDYTQGHE